MQKVPEGLSLLSCLEGLFFHFKYHHCKELQGCLWEGQVDCDLARPQPHKLVRSGQISLYLREIT